jgi:hypothetical protein
VLSAADALPIVHVRERHALSVQASPEEALAAGRAVTLDEVPVVRLLFRLRGLRALAGAPVWEVLGRQGFGPFGDDTLVAVGRPWSPRGGLREIADFAAFDERGYAKVALDLRARPVATGALLETETRVFLTDVASRRRFRAYWLAIRPFSGLVRRRWLRAARRRAEARI